MAVKAETGTQRTFPVVRCNPTVRSVHGFTLLELLVVLSILGVMVSLVAPNLTGLLAQDKAKVEAYALRDALQDVIDQSWLDGRSSFVEVQHNELVVWQRLQEQWQTQGSLYTLQSGLDYQLSTSSEQLSHAEQSLDMPGTMAWGALANAEYLPFRWRIQSAARAYTVVGDGINGLRIED